MPKDINATAQTQMEEPGLGICDKIEKAFNNKKIRPEIKIGNESQVWFHPTWFLCGTSFILVHHQT